MIRVKINRIVFNINYIALLSGKNDYDVRFQVEAYDKQLYEIKIHPFEHNKDNQETMIISILESIVEREFYNFDGKGWGEISIKKYKKL